MEETLLLFKPDSVKQTEIFDEVRSLIFAKGLKVSKLYQIKLCKDDISDLWPRCTDDYVSFQLLCHYLSNQNLLVVEVEGKEAIKKGLEIKKEIRKKYAVCRYANCLHTPSSIDEYYRTIRVFKAKKSSETVTKFPETNISDLDSLTTIFPTERLDECALNVWKLIKDATKDDLCNRWGRDTAKYTLLLFDDNVNTLSSVAANLYMYFQELSLEEIYISIICTDTFGKAILFEHNDINVLKHKLSLMQRHSLRGGIRENW